MLYDLSLPINNQVPSFPGTPGATVEQLATVENEGWNSKMVSFNSHHATHIDAPNHMNKHGKMLDQYPVEKFIGEAQVLDARGMKEIDLPVTGIKKGDMVFLCTGHSEFILKPEYFSGAPVISPGFANKLVEAGISIIGLDAPSPDNAPYHLHHLFFKHDILIVENLTNLIPLAGKRVKCTIAPLKIENADGAPCRVFAGYF